MSEQEQTRGAATSATRTFTVQCSYPTGFSRTVVVDASNAEEACERAIEIANESNAWRSSDDCGRTFVDAIAEGDDVDPWDVDSRLPVPLAFAEHGEVQMLREALLGLLDWAAAMGGWDAEAWRAAERAVGRPDAAGAETE